MSEEKIKKKDYLSLDETKNVSTSEVIGGMSRGITVA